jgi:hypothetical protein
LLSEEKRGEFTQANDPADGPEGLPIR